MLAAMNDGIDEVGSQVIFKALPCCTGIPSFLVCTFVIVPSWLQMTVEIAQEHLTWNLEAVERCTVLSTEASCPSHVRQLFHAAANQQTPNSCLLQQISRLVLTGLAAAVEAGVRASEAPYGVATAGSAGRTAIAKAASVVRYPASF